MWLLLYISIQGSIVVMKYEGSNYGEDQCVKTVELYKNVIKNGVLVCRLEI